MAKPIKSYKIAFILIFWSGVFVEEPVNAQNKTKDIFKPTPGKSLGITRINKFEILNAKPHSNPLSQSSTSGSYPYSSPTGLQVGPLKPGSPDGLSRRAP